MPSLVAQHRIQVKYQLDSLIQLRETEQVMLLLQSTIDSLKHAGAIDSLYHYPYYIAKAERLKDNIPEACKKMEDFVADMELANASQRSLYLAKVSMAEFYDEVGENEKSLEITEKTLAHVLKAKNVTPAEIAKIKYNLGVSYFMIDDLSNAKKHYQSALKDYIAYPKTDKKLLSDGYNALGGIMWLSTKLDSASYYYNKAAASLKLAQGDTISNLFHATVIESNVSLLAYSQGKFKKAIDLQNKVIRNYEIVLQNTTNPEFTSRARRFQANAISNLATFYNEVGNLSRANELVRYAYQKKQLFLEPTDDDLIAGLIQIGQSEISLKSYKKAIQSIQEGLKIYRDKNTVRPYWEAAAYNALASAYQGIGKIDSANYYYTLSEPLFEKALGESIDAEYLSFLKNKAEFESKQGNLIARQTAQKAFDYVVNQNEEESFETAQHILSLAQVEYNLQNYDKAYYWSSKGDDLLQKKSETVRQTVDAIVTDFNRPLLLLLKAQSRYKKLQNITTEDLIAIADELTDAIKILERRKEIALTPEDNNQLLLEYDAINDFSKQIQLELYNQTNDNKYLDALMTTQESGIYNRIRAKLNSQKDASFFNMPKAVLDEEIRKKEALHEALSIDSTSALSYYNKEKEWSDFLKTLKQKHPAYYKMRYATIEAPVAEIVKKIPEDVTVIRYFFVQENLYAYVANKGEQHLVTLDALSYSRLTEVIPKIVENQFDLDTLMDDLEKLYNQLWQPLKSINLKEKVVIIPDGPLYNLSFEMLASTNLTNYSQFTTNSILSKHQLSYTFSLLQLENNSNKQLRDNFIAFTPEFSESMKRDYRVAIKDSLDIDRTYLELLPQPFSAELAENYNRIFKGDHFKNKNATKEIFVRQAGEHKIIHIGTHAESNNLSPELSRLLFAKSPDASSFQDDNSLYTYEIYNCNLASNLAILTACETGKPSYQAGEGMISLAHAFTYAGSESILTSLWKIDEKSSAEIVAYFYDNLKEKMPKDKALQEAKLTYLKKAQGRTRHPNYWAGLVLMGDTTPLELSTSWPWWSWLILAALVLILAVTLSRKRKN